MINPHPSERISEHEFHGDFVTLELAPSAVAWHRPEPTQPHCIVCSHPMKDALEDRCRWCRCVVHRMYLGESDTLAIVKRMRTKQKNAARSERSRVALMKQQTERRK